MPVNKFALRTLRVRMSIEEARFRRYFFPTSLSPPLTLSLSLFLSEYPRGAQGVQIDENIPLGRQSSVEEVIPQVQTREWHVIPLGRQRSCHVIVSEVSANEIRRQHREER